jgi:hypothetical protein
MAESPSRTGRWPIGETRIQSLIDQRKLQVVQPSPEHAELLMGQADRHLITARTILDDDPTGAFSMLYDAARKAITAVLAQQGLRPTVAGGHRVVEDALSAQLAQSARPSVRRFRDLRRQRHEAEYPELGTPTVTAARARDGLADAERIVVEMKLLLPQVGPWPG